MDDNHHQQQQQQQPSSLLSRRSMELVHGQAPVSSKDLFDTESITFRIETTLAEMTELYQTTKQALTSSSSLSSSKSYQNDDTTSIMVEQAKALELSALELYQEARQQVQNDNHVLLIPCLVLHLDVGHLILEANDNHQTQDQHHDHAVTILNHSQRCKLVGRMVLTGLHLLELQRALYGDDHYDVARTYLDLSQFLQDLLSNSPDTLLQWTKTPLSPSPPTTTMTILHNLKSFRDWSTLEYQYRRQHERIKDLYPRDATTYIPNGVTG